MEDPRRAEDCQSLHSYRWKHETRSRCRSSTAHRGPALGQRQTSFEPCADEPSCVRTRRRSWPSSVRAQAPAKSTKSTVQSKPRSVLANQELARKKVEVARPAHLGALVAPKPRILDMIRNAASAGLLPEPLSARLDAIVEAASAFRGALDDSENHTARQYLRQSVAANRARTQRSNNHEPNNFRCRTDGPHLPARWRRFRTHICPTPKKTTQCTTAPSTTFPSVRQNSITAVARHLVQQSSMATRDQRSRICTTRMPPICGFTTQTSVQAVS